MATITRKVRVHLNEQRRRPRIEMHEHYGSIYYFGLTPTRSAEPRAQRGQPPKVVHMTDVASSRKRRREGDASTE